MVFVPLHLQLRRFALPPDQITTAVHHDGCYVTATLTPSSGGWVCVDLEPGPCAFTPPLTLVVAASSSELEAAAEATLARETDVRRWSPVSTIPVLLLSLLADLNL
jgi:hypothetical protein